MDKEKARKIIEGWIRKQGGYVRLPFVDELIHTEQNEQGTFDQWTFKGLIKIAYDL